MLLGKSLREAHGFTPEDDSYTLKPPLCRNGCGLDYFTIAVRQVQQCSGTANVSLLPGNLARRQQSSFKGSLILCER
jgi:hypothetical protein